MSFLMHHTSASPHIQEESPQKISIEWNSLPLSVWQGYLARVEKSNLIQTYAYARALRFVRKQVTRFGLIRIGGVPKGLVQVQEVGLLGLHFVFLDRGPLWFEPVTLQDIEEFYSEFNRMFPKRFGRKRRVMPELPVCEKNRAMMEHAGFSFKSRGYRSIWLKCDGAFFSRFNGSARNMVRKAEKAGLKAETGLENLSVFLRAHAADRAAKKYFGPSLAMLRHLCREFGRDTFLLCARDGAEIIAGVLIFIHGTCATYQAGWSNEKGREKAAHNFLLAQAVPLLEKRGVARLDLGGVNDEAAEGVTAFKRALGGKDYELCGVYT